MDEAIKNICNALKQEADAVISNTDRIYSTLTEDDTDDAAQVFSMIRLDGVEHIQNLTLALTKQIMSPTSTAADKSGDGE